MSIKILKNKIDWDNFLSTIDNYDFYHTYDYHQISKSSSDTQILIKYEKDGVIIGLPLLIRKIYNSNYFDAISVYGYSGPVYNFLPPNENLKKYNKALAHFLFDIKVVSVFIRLHPYINNQDHFFHNFGELVCLGRVINIDLTKDLKIQKREYSRRLKNQVNKASKNCIIKKANSEVDFKIFQKLYYENMKRVNAKSFYYFSEDYFKRMINAKDFKTEILLAYDEETQTPIAGCMFIKTNKIIQYHLSASCSKYLHLNGTKVLIDKMRSTATNEGFSFFNLGGGLGANNNDNLFRFKSAFSNDFKYFYIWKYIVRKDTYAQLCLESEVSDKALDFFPKYRYKEFDNKY